MITLYYAPGSSSMAAHIALHEIGVPFEAIPLSFSRGDTQTSDYLARNPEGKVPTLMVDGWPLTEVAAILFYLGRRSPEARLLPTNIEDEARVISWMSFAASTLHPARRQGIEHATAAYRIADHRLAGREWAVERYSVGDIHLFRLFWRFNASLHPSPTDFPNLIAHHNRMLARAAVRRTIETESSIGYELPA